jgi:alanine racemase
MVIDNFPKSGLASFNLNLDTVINNYQTLAGQSSRADCAAVVKANAYGMGMAEIAKALYENTKCRTFFVANLYEAVTLRSHVKDADIYVFNGLFDDQVDCYLEHNIRPILNELSQVKLWQGKKEPCAIHFDTGINRLGFNEDDTERFLGSGYDLNLSLILSHFIRSDEADHNDNKKQLERFTKIRNELPNSPASLCNSAGIYLGEEYHFDLLRPGIMLYGGNPRAIPLPADIRLVFDIKVRILQIRNIKKDMTVGYNATWQAQKNSRIALLNVGYADGYLTLNSNKGKVWLNGEIVPVIGKVSMDMVAIDITGSKFDKIAVLDEVELLGPNIPLEMASEVSSLGQYELLTGVGNRFHKNYNKK